MNKINKRTNMFFLLLLLVHLGASIIVSALLLGPVKIGIIAELIITVAIVIVPCCLFFLINKYNISDWISFKKIKFTTVILIVLFTAFISPVVIMVNVLSQLFSSNAVQEMAVDFLQAPAVVIVILVGIIAPFGEEFAFRGIIYGGFRKHSLSILAAMVSALYFGLMHLNFNQCSYAIVLGFIFCLLVEATDSLWASVIAHALVNSVNVIEVYAVQSIYEENGKTIENVLDSAGNITSSEILITAFACGFVVMITIIPALAFFYLICKNENRWEYVKKILTGSDTKEREGRMITISGIIAIAICLFVMFLLDPLINLLQGMNIL